jgi:hypothetical protein
MVTVGYSRSGTLALQTGSHLDIVGADPETGAAQGCLAP